MDFFLAPCHGRRFIGAEKLILKSKTRFFKLFIDIILALFFLFSVLIVIDNNLVSVRTGMYIYGVAALFLTLKIFTSKRIGIFGPAFILILYTVLSCFGNDILVLLLGRPRFLRVIASSHAYLAYYNLANALFYVGCFSWLMGISYDGPGLIRRTEKSGSKELTDFEINLYLKVTLAIIWAYVVWWALMLTTGQTSLTNYAEIRSWLSTKPVQMYLLRLSWVAMPTYMYFASKRSQLIQFSIPVLLMTAVLLLTGNRNEIMYPLATCVGVYIWKRRLVAEKRAIPIVLIIAVVLMIFVISPMISSTRKIGFGLSTLLSGSYGFVNALSEMGKQINPFSIILFAIDSGRYAFQYGMTLFVPIISLVSLNLIFGTSLYHTVYNPTLVLNQLNHYGLGFSYITEAYINFGLLGIIILFLLLGRYCGASENVTNKGKKTLIYFQIMPLLMLWSRNVFGLNFIIVIFVIILNIAIRLMSEIREQRNLK